MQTAQQSFLPPVPEESSLSGSSLGHISTATHAVSEAPKAHVEAIYEIQTVEPATVRSHTKQVGTQITSLDDPASDMAYERDHSFIIIPSSMKQKMRRSHRRSGTPKICFPEPPPSPSQSSSTSASDSSIYYIKKHKSRKHQVHAKRPAKQAIAFEPSEYAVVSKRSVERAQQKPATSRQNYLKSGSLNRVGAFDGIPRQNSSQSSIDIQPDAGSRRRSDESDSFDRRNAHLYEHIEAFNPLAAFKPKMLSQYTSTEKIDGNRKLLDDIGDEPQSIDSRRDSLVGRQERAAPERQHLGISSLNADMLVAEALSQEVKSVNKRPDEPQIHENIKIDERFELKSSDENTNTSMNANYRNETDNQSVGSFLSMASVKSFPKCQVPDALNTVLLTGDKVALSKYDEITATQEATSASRIPRIVDTKFKNAPRPAYFGAANKEASKANANRDVNYFTRSRSDATDPGVIGPIAFNFHKKRMDSRGTAFLLRTNRPIKCKRHNASLATFLSTFKSVILLCFPFLIQITLSHRMI